MRLAPGGLRYAVLIIGLAAASVLFSPLVSLGLVAVGLFVLWFFRDPDRQPPTAGVVAPADGRISVIRQEGEQLRVGVYMGPFDVHVNRAPLPGTVTAVDHRPGAHRVAFGKESDHNEQVEIAADGWTVVLIAGAFARRITPYVEPGTAVERGDRIGHIAFGSRADVICPPGMETDDLAVAEGDRVVAGETVLVDEA